MSSPIDHPTRPPVATDAPFRLRVLATGSWHLTIAAALGARTFVAPYGVAPANAPDDITTWIRGAGLALAHFLDAGAHGVPSIQAWVLRELAGRATALADRGWPRGAESVRLAGQCGDVPIVAWHVVDAAQPALDATVWTPAGPMRRRFAPSDVDGRDAGVWWAMPATAPIAAR